MLNVTAVWRESTIRPPKINEYLRFKCYPSNSIIQPRVSQRTDHVIGLERIAHPNILGSNDHPRAEIKSTETQKVLLNNLSPIQTKLLQTEMY